MRTKPLLWVTAAAAVFVLGIGAAGAFVPIELTTHMDWATGNLLGATPYAYQYNVMRSVRDYAALRLGEGYPWQFDLAYNDDKFAGNDFDTWTAVLAYERPVDGWGWGLQVPEQYSDASGIGSLWYEGVTGYGYYNVSPEARVGAFANVNYAWSDVTGINDDSSWGLGAFGSYAFKVSDNVTITPALVYLHYDAGQTGFDNSDVFSAGSGFDFKLSAELSLEAKIFYNIDKSNDSIDDTYWDWDAGLAYAVDKTWTIRGSIGTTESFENFDRTTFRIGVLASF